MTSSTRLASAAAAATAIGVLLSGCGGAGSPSSAAKSGGSGAATKQTSIVSPAPAASADSSTSKSAPAKAPSSAAAAPSVRVLRTVAHNLNVPWGIVFLPNGNALVSSRDRARIYRVNPSGGQKTIGTVSGVVSNGASGGEAGLSALHCRRTSRPTTGSMPT